MIIVQSPLPDKSSKVRVETRVAASSLCIAQTYVEATSCLFLQREVAEDVSSRSESSIVLSITPEAMFAATQALSC